MVQRKRFIMEEIINALTMYPTEDTLTYLAKNLGEFININLIQSKLRDNLENLLKSMLESKKSSDLSKKIKRYNIDCVEPIFKIEIYDDYRE